MGRGTPRHYSVKRNGRAFWQPTASMRRRGFQSVPLGPDGPDAYRIAEEWNRRWDADRAGLTPSAGAPAANLRENPWTSDELTAYAQGSIGAGFRAFRRTDEWARKAPKTREDWFRAWRHIKPVFGNARPSAVSLEAISAFRSAIEAKVSLREAHRVIKIWRALWKVLAALLLCQRDADPSLGVRNTAARGRSEVWIEGEAVRLVKRAWRMGYRGLAAAVAVAWDTQLNPGDVCPLVASQMATAGRGELFFTARGKTGVPVGGGLSARAMAVLAAYLEGLGATLHGDAPIFRNRSGTPYTVDKLGKDFAIVRSAEFGEGERRQLGHDFRRSGAVEAIAGDAEPAAVAHAMGNTLNTSNALFATYVPVNAATIRSVMTARRLGRRRLR